MKRCAIKINLLIVCSVCISQTDGTDAAKSSANLSEAGKGYCTVSRLLCNDTIRGSCHARKRTDRLLFAFQIVRIAAFCHEVLM